MLLSWRWKPPEALALARPPDDDDRVDDDERVAVEADELSFGLPKNGLATHVNSFELGQHGRYRTNVWQYKGVNTLRPGRMEELALHPTVKPVQLMAEAIKDVSRRGAIVLDLFGGSGSTLIAAHKTGRRGFLCELDPLYCDRIIRRWEAYAKDDAEQIACGIDVGDRRPSKAA